MKIVFICGSIERGFDGVGDYTRRMAQSLMSVGHEVSIIALSDPYVKEQQREIIESENGIIGILRLPMHLGLSESAFLIKNELSEIKPDWVSLQFVIFAFHPKGLPFGLGHILANALKDYKVQIMFHELWLGIGEYKNLKHVIWGLFQKRIIKSMLYQVNPALLHTNSSWYAIQLRKIAKKVGVLPLFSNIPVVPEYHQVNRNIIISKLSSVSFVVFGHISLHAPVAEFVKELSKISEKNKIDFSITFIGKSNSDISRWSAAWSPNFKVNVLGIQSEGDVSKYISQADIGISTTPYALLGKSGSLYAFLEHGLPVINVSDLHELTKERIDFKAPKGLFEYKIGNLEEIFNQLELPENSNQLENTIDLFLNDLKSIEQGFE